MILIIKEKKNNKNLLNIDINTKYGSRKFKPNTFNIKKDGK